MIEDKFDLENMKKEIGIEIPYSNMPSRKGSSIS